MRFRRIAARCRRWRLFPTAVRTSSMAAGRRSCRRRSGHPRTAISVASPRQRPTRSACPWTTTSCRSPSPARGAGRAFEAGLGHQGGGVDVELAPVQLQILDVGVVRRRRRPPLPSPPPRRHPLLRSMAPPAHSPAQRVRPTTGRQYQQPRPAVSCSGNHHPARIPCERCVHIGAKLWRGALGAKAWRASIRHCEAHSDEAIQSDCAALDALHRSQ